VNSTRQAIFIVLFILIGLPSCALGGCFLMMGTGSPQTEPGVLAVGFGGIFVFIVLLVLMIKYSKK
jgi:hypothetical protein